MFRSATFKLTAWYLGIIMVISLLFSLFIYQINFHEVNLRLENLQRSLTAVGLATDTTTNNEARSIQSQAAANQMIQTLFYINVVVLVGGGVGSYWLARRTLRPIEDAHEAQTRFTSDASHELRTPLAAMKAELEVSLRDPNLTVAESRELLESNLEEVNKLIKLSELFLKLSRLDYDTLEKKQLDLVDLLGNVLKQFSRSKKRFEVVTRKSALMYGNEAAILELMTVLIDNAIKYSPKGSKIGIRIFERRMMVAFEITNSGEPIPEDKQSKLFERFYRGDSSRTESNRNGYGLGLAIAKRITEIHHGDIQVKSNEKGTTFTFHLPNLRNIQNRIQNPKL